MNENYNDCHHRKTTRTYIYKKQKVSKRFYIQNADTFQKARQFPLRFYIHKKPYTLHLGFLMKFIKLAFIYKKHGTSQKARQFAIRFYIQKTGTLRYAIFH